jgi:co-chaperonin GroES (HSP10)
MKIILTEDQYEQLTEMIKLDIKVGDTIMGGKFKNKKVVVKTIGKNDKGDISINGKPLL